MLLSEDERQRVVALLLETVAVSPREQICAVVGTEFATKLPMGLVMALAIVREALRLCEEDDFAHDPPWLRSLLTLIQLRDPAPQIIARLKNPPPKPPDPVDAVLLTSDMPFVNRSILRKRLRVLRNPLGTKRILVVNGPRCSGKSYTREMIDHLSDGSLRHCHVKLQSEQVASTGAREVARDLVSLMGQPLDRYPTDNTNEDRWTQELANWVLLEAVNTPRNWWLVLDGFNHPDLRADTRKLIRHLADQVNNGIFVERCRLVLLDFDFTGLAVSPARILFEELDPPPQLDGEILPCVTAILSRGRNQDADAAVMVAAIIQALPNGNDRLPALNRQLVDLMAEGEADD